MLMIAQISQASTSRAHRRDAHVKAAWMPVRNFAAAVLFLGAALAHAGDADVNSVGRLQAKYLELRNQLSNNQFRKPIYLDSRESADAVTGDIYALIDHPFVTAAAALNDPGGWCEILILHTNTKYCRLGTGGPANVLKVSIGKKYDQPLDQAYRMELVYRGVAQASDYLQVNLSAEQGPLSTSNYRIVLEAVPVNMNRTFIHLSYSYAFGMVGRLAMQAYLGTIGKSKVGFAVVGTQADGQPLYIGGMRGLVERNTMRYYLAIEAFLGALSAPPQARLERRLREWYAATERYPRQLHELEQREYLEMKRREHLRQQTG